MKREELSDRRMILFPDMGVLPLMLLLCMGFARGLYGQGPDPPEIAIVPKPVGSGARALGQSAFIAVADDATAASWNPAGLINLEEPEVSFVGAWKATTYDYVSTDTSPTIDRDNWEDGEINFISCACPLKIANTDAVLSINYHQVYDFGLEFNYTVTEDEEEVRFSGSSEGALASYSLAGGLSIPPWPKVTVGASINWYTSSFLNDYAWRETRGSLFEESIWRQTETFDNFDAYNFTFGALWDVFERDENLLTLGFVCHTPFTATFDREIIEIDTGFEDSLDVSERWKMDFPLSLAAGVNYRFSDRFSTAFDVEWKQWSHFEQREPNGTVTTPIGEGKGDIDDTLAFRLGGECLRFSGPDDPWVWALRGGVFYEPRPALDETIPVYGFSLGLGWTLKKRLSLDFAYQFRRTEEVDGHSLGTGLEDIDYSIQEHFLVSSVVAYF